MKDEWGKAVWIGSAHPFDLHEVYLDFRSPIVQGKVGDSVELLISADSRYKLWLNGEFVARGPSRSYPTAQSFDRIDLSNAWRDGDNVLAIQVYQPGYSHFSYVHRAAAGMLAALSVNGEQQLVSDAAWRARRSRVFSSDVPRVSIYGSGVEVQNLEFEDDWREVAFSAETWDAARIIAAANGHIWRGLTERITPMLVESSAELHLVESRISEDEMLFEDAHWGLRNAWKNGEVAEFATDQDGWIRPILDFDHTALWLFDLGRAYTCQGTVEIRNATGDEQISISYADKMVNGELIISDPTTYCRVQLTDSFMLRAGNQVVEPHTMRGGRYVLIQLSGNISENIALRPSVTVAEYPLESTTPLTTSDQQLSNIIALCENTVRSCLQDSFVDCNWRESSQWLGDGLIQAKTLASMCDDFRPMRKLLRDTTAGQDSSGMLPSIAPGEVHAYTIPRYALMWVELLAFDYSRTGDVAFVCEMWPTLTAQLDALMSSSNDDGLLVNPTGRRFYLDWSPTSQNDPHAVYNLHSVLALQVAVKLAEEVGVSAKEWAAQSTLLLDSTRETFFENDRWYDDRERSTFSQLAAALALLAGAIEVDEQAPLLDAIVARSLDPSDEHQVGKMVLASPFMHHYLFECLEIFGRNQSIIEIIKLRWGRWADAGQPTTWENWNIDFPDGSACHAFSAHPRYHLTKALNV